MTKKKNIKKPKVNPTTGKIIQQGDKVSSPNGGSDKLQPIFSFYNMKDDVYCVNTCSKDQQSALLKSLCKFSKFTWQELRNAPRHGLGCEKISQDSIKGVNVKSFITPDVTLLAFRASGMSPVVGYREEQIFHILWIDSNFTLYKH